MTNENESRRRDRRRARPTSRRVDGLRTKDACTQCYRACVCCSVHTQTPRATANANGGRGACTTSIVYEVSVSELGLEPVFRLALSSEALHRHAHRRVDHGALVADPADELEMTP